MSIKKILFLLLAVTLFCCCSSDDGDGNNLNGFEKYEGTWGPVVYTVKGEEHLCNPEYPDINNIPRLIFLKWHDNEIIMRTEHYYNGEWKHVQDYSLFWHNGGFYKVKLVGSSSVEMGKPYTDIVLSGETLYLQSDPGTKYKKIK
jgi:hypothetical protein